jgi:hypothetical protein
LPFHRIAPGVKDGKDNDSSRFDAVEHRVWKAARLHASDFAMLYGKSVRGISLRARRLDRFR